MHMTPPPYALLRMHFPDPFNVPPEDLIKIWGEPEKFGAALLREKVGDRRGVIRFVGLWGPFDPQGHIDLICHGEHHRLACEGGHVYAHAVECWFWACP